MDKGISEAAAAMGRKSGKARLEKHGVKYFQEMGKKGAEARWGKKEKPEDQKEDELDNEGK